MSAGCSRSSLRWSCALFCLVTRLSTSSPRLSPRYRRVLELLVDEPFDEARLAQERGDLDQGILDALAAPRGVRPPGIRRSRT